MDSKRFYELAGVAGVEEALNEDAVDQAGKVLGQLEQAVAREAKKFDQAEKRFKPQYLKIAAGALVWSLVENRVEEMTGEDIEEVADELGMTLEEFAKANPKTLIKLIIGQAMDEAEEKAGDDGVEETLGIDHGDLSAHINGVKF